jgi:hypothetical protein
MAVAAAPFPGAVAGFEPIGSERRTGVSSTGSAGDLRERGEPLRLEVALAFGELAAIVRTRAS